jgi:hypothetical protein
VAEGAVRVSAASDEPDVTPRGLVALRETPEALTIEEMLADYGFAQVAAWGALGEHKRADAWQAWANDQWLGSPAWRERAARVKARAGA